MRRALACCALLALGAAPAAPAANGSVRASVRPATAHLGDRLRYTVEARVPGVPVSAVTVVADTGAFATLAPEAVTRSTDHGVAVVRVVETIACLDRGCAPTATAHRASLPRPRVTVGGRALVGRAAAVTIVPRVPDAAVLHGDYRRQTALPPVGSRLPLGEAAAGAFAAAAVLALAALALTASALRRRRPAADGAAGLPGLDLALRLLRQSAGRPVPDRRRAADLVGRLVRSGDTADAERVAWSASAPAADDVERLADRIEHAGERRP